MAVAVGLAMAAGGSVTGVADASARASLQAGTGATAPAAPAGQRGAGGHDLDPGQRANRASRRPCCARLGLPRPDRVRMEYRTHDAAVSRRDVEPHRLTYGGRRWYLVALDTTRADRRTFRADRIDLLAAPGPRFTQRELPQDIAEYVRRGVMTESLRYWASVQVDAPAAQVAETMRA